MTATREWKPRIHAYQGIVEECYRIDGRAISERNLWTAGAEGRLPVSACGTKFAHCINAGNNLAIYSRTRLLQRIMIARKPTGVPGRRPGIYHYLVCPRCHTTRYVLYSLTGCPETSACHQCLRLAYRFHTYGNTTARYTACIVTRKSERAQWTPRREQRLRRIRSNRHCGTMETGEPMTQAKPPFVAWWKAQAKTPPSTTDTMHNTIRAGAMLIVEDDILPANVISMFSLENYLLKTYRFQAELELVMESFQCAYERWDALPQ
jgi:hypothetical protein